MDEAAKAAFGGIDPGSVVDSGRRSGLATVQRTAAVRSGFGSGHQRLVRSRSRTEMHFGETLQTIVSDINEIRRSLSESQVEIDDLL